MFPPPTFEIQLLQHGRRRIAGVDEAGRGAWAGPLTAAAVILPGAAYGDPRLLAGVTDSKRLSAAVRERLARRIAACAVAVGVAHVTPREIDGLGMAAAGRLAMGRALERLAPAPDHVILDAFPLDDASPFAGRQTALIRADASCLAVAAASICAKVARDRLMRLLSGRYPAYAFERNKGYGTPRHRAALTALGALPVHRYSFAPVRDVRASSRLALAV